MKGDEKRRDRGAAVDGTTAAVVLVRKERTNKMTNRDASYDSRVLGWGGFAMAAFFAATMMMGIARAEDDHHRGPHGGKRQPPPAAFEACQGKKADDGCEVVFGERKIEGSCKAFREGALFCRPARPPKSHDQGTDCPAR